MVSISRIDPMRDMLTKWPFGNITEELKIGLELMKKSKTYQIWCIAPITNTHEQGEIVEEL